MFSKIQLFPNEHIIADKAESWLYTAEKIYSSENQARKDLWSKCGKEKSIKNLMKIFFYRQIILLFI
jgi:hypothetical protein